ncbi:MAG: D-arabinose 5-phosphate isomerase [Flavobacteriales bacterium]|nr:D-arabinose 5-phosphate isomerase [Flavobacteriales bacterium]|tara:strand:+ start:14132 stop:15094 length:963 start_codon:yes stop_codon:yes gene_type:complete
MKKVDIIKTAKEVIELQSNTIANLEKFIDKNFQNVVNLLKNINGHLIVIGIGKSAIIGKKIVATLNSTGTPSIFIHGVEAIHGDLGSIKKDDVILFISKSGNTNELKKIFSVIKSQKNKTIAMTANKDSYLSKNSDFFLNTFVKKEACPNNLAPTTSSTAQLVMGDALAICLLKLKGFSKNDFARYHPGGILGKKITMKVSDIYNEKLNPKVSKLDSFQKVIIEISSKRMGAVCVVENSKILGIITDGDLRRYLQKNQDISNTIAENLMTRKPKTIDKNELAFSALNKMKKNNITQLLVLSNNEYSGIIHLHDILNEKII